MFEKVKPTKHHYNRWIRECKAVYISGTDEPICGIHDTLVSNALNQLARFERFRNDELALCYGLKRRLITLGKKEGRYYSIHFTDKGFAEIKKLQEVTCIFTGRRIR